MILILIKTVPNVKLEAIIDNVHSSLFDTYLAVPDAEHHQCTKNLYDDWMDQVRNMKITKFKHSIQQAKARYNLFMFLSKWEQEEVIALKAKLEDMKDATLHLTEKLKTDSTKDPIPAKDRMKKSKESKRDKNRMRYKKFTHKDGKPMSKKLIRQHGAGVNTI